MSQVTTSRLGRDYSALTVVVSPVMARLMADLGDQGLVLDGTVSRIAFQVKNVGANILNGFEVSAQIVPGEDFFTLIGQNDWVSGNKLLLHSSGNLSNLAVGATIFVVIDTSCLYALSFEAKSTSGTTLDLKGNARG